ncbi:MAG: alanine--glyoxylate aminotransferase family protein [Cyclobacteriaceae bacterium]
MKKIYFTPGPSETYFTVQEHIKNAFNKGIPSISHRSAEFKSIFQETEENLRNLLNLPEESSIAFTTSATEVWERITEGLVDTYSFHIVNGYFSNKFFKAATALGKNTTVHTSAPGTCVDVQSIQVPEESELIGLAQNETSTGAALPLGDIYTLKEKYPKKLLAIDVVSSLPVVDMDFSKVDTAYCSVQKCFGLPAGLGIWIYNKKCLDKAEELSKAGKLHNAYHSLPNLEKFGQNHQTVCTPNVLYIYLLGKVAGDMLMKGMDMIRRESHYKSALIYNLFESHPSLSPFVKEKRFRSITLGVAEIESDSAVLIAQMAKKGLVIGSGYGEFRKKHIRIANFPTHSKEQMEMLVDTITSMEF